MGRLLQRLSFAFAAGCVGALVNSVALWLAGQNGLTKLLQVDINPRLTPAWLYPRLVWGGLWGFLLLLPLLKSKPLLRGILISLGPTLAQLFYFFPTVAHKGLMGVELGTLTPLLVFVFNAIWGLSAVLWLKLADKNI
jgi:hypothetical protein